MRGSRGGHVWWLYGILALQGVLGAMTGDRACGDGMHDPDAKLDTYTIDVQPDATSLDTLGWLAIGFGKSMDTSPTVILWPNGEGSYILSQRNPNGYKPPTVPETLTRIATLLPDQSYANSSAARAVFSLPAASVSANPISLIWAFSDKHPGSTESSAPIKIHTATGYMSLALNSPVNGAGEVGKATAGDSNSEGPKGKEPFKGRLGIMLIHAICGGLACLLVIPAAVLVPRIARGFTRERWWFPVHAAANGVVAVTQFHKGFQATHRAFGLCMFIIMCIQVLLGIGVHWIKVKRHRFMTVSGRGPSNFIHMALGVFCMGLGFATVWTGFDGWDYFSGAEPMSKWWRIGWMAVVSSWCIAYLGGLVVCLPRQLRAEREAREKASRIDKAMIRLKDRSGSDSHSSISSFSIGKQHAALWPNQYGEGKEVLSPGGTTVLALAPTLSAETWKRGSDDGDSRFGRTPITTVGLGVSRSGTLASQRSGVSAAWNGQVGAAYTADSPRQMSSHVAQQVDGGYDRQPPHIVGDTTPTTGKRWSGETTSPVREVVLEDKDVPSRALNAWGSGHARKRSGANW